MPFHGILSNTGQFSLLNHMTDHVHSLFAHCLQHLPASPLWISQKQQGNSIFKVSNMLFHLIAHYDEFFTVNNQGGSQCDWPPPLSNLTMQTDLTIKNHLVLATLAISNLKTCSHSAKWLQLLSQQSVWLTATSDHTHSSFQPSSPSTHFVSIISTISDLKKWFHSIKRLHTVPLPISTLRASLRSALPPFFS